MTCGELEILLADYLDGVTPAVEAREVEAHIAGCAACAELARDSRLAIAFIERSAEIEPPPNLAARILMETASGRHGRLASPRGIRGWLERAFAPLLQPRLVMGMALTMFSFTVMARWTGISLRQLQPSDMEPAKVWASLDDRANRAWVRSVKFYESLKFVYEIQSRLRDWNEQQEEEERNAAVSRPVEDRRVPAAAPQSQGR
jgi:anti-sigma factor RsiW